MSDEKEELERRWRETAELLGVAPGPPPAADAPRAPAVRPREPDRPMEERVTKENREERPRVWQPEPEPAEPAEDLAPELEEPDFLDEEPPAEPAPAISSADEEPGPAREGGEDSDERPRRRRGRRGRRGGRRDERGRDERGPRRERDDGIRAGPEPPSQADRDEDSSESRVRDRFGEPAAQEIAEGPETDDVEPEESPEDAGLEQELAETVAEWNVPSWTELIDSLYRPGR